MDVKNKHIGKSRYVFDILETAEKNSRFFSEKAFDALNHIFFFNSRFRKMWLWFYVYLMRSVVVYS